MDSKLLTVCRVIWKRRAMEQSRGWSRERLLAHQNAAAWKLRRLAYERSPFYRRFHQGLENRPLRELPVLTKPVLMENFDDVVTDRSVRLADLEGFLASPGGDGLFRGRYVVLATSGSTGLRGVFLFDRDEWLTALALIARPMGWAGVRPNPLRPARAVMIASTSRSHYSARVSSAMATRWMPSLRMDAAEPLSGMVEKLNRWQPEILAAYPSVLRELAEEQIGGRLRIPLRHVACSAEVLTTEARRRVAQAWNVKVYNTYGATEYAPIAAECDYGRMHLFEDGALIEIADERGPVPPGAAGNRVLITVFYRRAQPLIRYEISDMVQSIEGQCPCGRPYQMIDTIEGRTEDVVSLPAAAGGTVSIHPNAFHRVLETVPAAGWQVMQREDGLRINLVGLRDLRAAAEIVGSVRVLLEASGAAGQTVEVCQVAELARGATGKAPLVMARKPARVAC
jgi:phenylacetate-CoA ligase